MSSFARRLGRMLQMDHRLLFVVVMLSMVIGGCTPSLRDPVEVDGGRVAGVRAPDSRVRSYKGIPFAAPPVGDLRWRPPEPVIPWEGVKQADSFSDACVQDLPRSRLPWTEEFMHQGDASEDCLYLNVWTAAERPGEKRPVMVYIYGGALREGSSAVAVYDGEALARKGVVSVGINYRIGPLGFLAHPELTRESEHGASGNYGFLDQLAALEWVQANIGAFGGDPDNVTIHGQSAGARSVQMLMQSPLSRGLITRAIIQSGSPHRAPVPPRYITLAEAEEAGVAAQEVLGVGSLAELREVPAERFIEPDVGRMGAIRDGWFMPTDVQNEVEVPVMAGFTADDGLSREEDSEPTVEDYRVEAKERYGEHAETFLALYPVDSNSDVPAVKLEAARDRARVTVSIWARLQQEKSDRVYTYYFDRAIPWPEHPEFGAFHSGELPYVFDNLELFDRPWEAVDRTVADQMSSYWVNFAATGNPNGDGLPEWPEFDASEDVTMRLGEVMGPMPIAEPEKVQFWKMLLTQSLD